MTETIYTNEDLLEMLDSLLREPTQFWNDFYTDREKAIPFFDNKPDENIVDYFNKGLISPGRVLELGCGPGRNAIYLTEKGCQVDAVDLSETTLQWAEERCYEKGLKINFIQANIFDLQIEDEVYDFVYDSGCFHHIAPHRRMNYIDLVKKSLKPGGKFGLSCFVQGGKFGGSDITDWEVYRQRSLQGGLGFTEEKLRKIFNEFMELEIRKMRAVEESEQVFGISGLLTALFQK